MWMGHSLLPDWLGLQVLYKRVLRAEKSKMHNCGSEFIQSNYGEATPLVSDRYVPAAGLRVEMWPNSVGCDRRGRSLPRGMWGMSPWSKFKKKKKMLGRKSTSSSTERSCRIRGPELWHLRYNHAVGLRQRCRMKMGLDDVVEPRSQPAHELSPHVLGDDAFTSLAELLGVAFSVTGPVRMYLADSQQNTN